MTEILCACKSPIFEVDGDDIIIISKHHGEHHRTILPLERLIQMVNQAKTDRFVDSIKVLH